MEIPPASKASVAALSLEAPTRTRDRIIAESDRTIIGFEMKTSTAVEAKDFQDLRWFLDEGPGKNRPFVGIVVYMGDRVLSFGGNMFALPCR
jgi:hypothetical protein